MKKSEYVQELVLLMVENPHSANCNAEQIVQSACNIVHALEEKGYGWEQKASSSLVIQNGRYVPSITSDTFQQYYKTWHDRFPSILYTKAEVYQEFLKSYSNFPIKRP